MSLNRSFEHTNKKVFRFKAFFLRIRIKSLLLIQLVKGQLDVD